MSSKSPLINSKKTAWAADAILVIATLVTVFPFLWIAWTAIKPEELAFRPGATNFTPTLESFELMFGRDPALLYLGNTLFVAGVTTIIALTLGGAAAYAMARYDIGGDRLKVGFLFPIMVPPIAFSLSMFIAFDRIGVLNARATIVLAYMTFAIPFAVWFLTSFFEEFPEELEEAAMVDGDTRIEALLYTVIPNLKPAFFATGILIFIYSWNNFVFPFLLTTDSRLRTMPVLVSTYVTSSDLLVSHMSAAIIITVAPVLILAYFLSKYLVAGISAESGID
jgi:multiple sugar transport system permease protein